MVAKYYLLMLLLVVSLISDIMTHKVNNRTILSFVICGLILNVYQTGLTGIFESLFAGVIPIIILGVFFIMNMLGAGEMKLFSAIGTIMGVNFIIKTLICSALAGGLIALIVLVLRCNVRERLGYLYNYLKHCFMTRSLSPYSSYCDHDDFKFPYVYAIATGTMITLLIT